MAFSENLKYLLSKNNMTEAQLAEELGVTLKNITEWETNGVLPETEQLSAMCDMFNVTIDELVRGNVAESDGQRKDFAKNNQKLASVIDWALLALSVVIYLIIGIAAGKWHPAWVIFIFALSVSSFTHALTNGALRGLQTSGELGGGVMLLAVAVYLVLGFVAGLWHPGWIIFIAAIILDCLIGYMMNKK